MLKKLLAYLFIGIMLTVPPLYYIDNFLLSDDAVNPVSAIGKVIGLAAERIKVDIPEEAKYTALTHDSKYIAYVSSDKLYIKDVKSSTIVKEIQEDHPVVYALPFSDRDIVMYLAYDGDKLHLSTYDIAKDEIRSHKSFRSSKFNRISDVKYSSYTNLIYINAETDSNSDIMNKIYRINIMSRVSLYTSGKKIANMALESGKDSLVYEDSKNNIYIRNKLFKLPDEKKFKLLGIGSDDKLYLLSVKYEGRVYIIKEGSSYDELKLDNPNYRSIINKDEKVYLIYNDHILDLTSNRKISIEPNSSIIDISGDHILYQSQDGDIIVKNL